MGCEPGNGGREASSTDSPFPWALSPRQAGARAGRPLALRPQGRYRSPVFLIQGLRVLKTQNTVWAAPL